MGDRTGRREEDVVGLRRRNHERLTMLLNGSMSLGTVLDDLDAEIRDAYEQAANAVEGVMEIEYNGMIESPETETLIAAAKAVRRLNERV